MTMGTSNDALATIAGLKQRIEWLEESIGRLLLEKEQKPAELGDHPRDNCCMTFTDASPDLERALALSRNNCCVHFRSTKIDAKRERRKVRFVVILASLAVFLFFFGFFITSGSRPNSNAKLNAEAALKLD